MPLITCPDCGVITDLPQINRTADEFCPKCDYPLFWAQAAAGERPATRDGDENLRRLPGTGGRRTIGARSCDECGEHNALTATHCIRCGIEFDAPEIIEEPEPVVVVAPEPEPEPEPDRTWIWWLVALMVLLLIVTVLAIAFA